MINNKIVFLGIDGAGKSTMVNLTKKYLDAQGFNAEIIQFHKWIFADKLRRLFGKILDKDRKDRNSPYSPDRNSIAAFIKPLVALIDNIFFYLFNRPRHDNQIYIYDRFICATQIKFIALNYRAMWMKLIWWNIHPSVVILFDIDVETSVRRQITRNDPYAYTAEQLKIEREFYLRFANEKGAFILDNRNNDIDTTFNRIKDILDHEIINCNCK